VLTCVCEALEETSPVARGQNKEKKRRDVQVEGEHPAKAFAQVEIHQRHVKLLLRAAYRVLSMPGSVKNQATVGRTKSWEN
jgi:hypothetical protein